VVATDLIGFWAKVTSKKDSFHSLNGTTLAVAEALRRVVLVVQDQRFGPDAAHGCARALPRLLMNTMLRVEKAPQAVNRPKRNPMAVSMMCIFCVH
jgi:hypothetical protein